MRRFRQGLRYAMTGLVIVWREEANFRIEIACAVLAFALSAYLKLRALEFALVALAIGLVLAVETLNTALEELCDKFSPTHDPHIAKIKDLAAAAVLIASIGAGSIGLIIFIPHFL